MPNTNFQTIHQMGGAINSFVKQATGRDNVQNIDMEHITVAQNHYYEDVDISGRFVSFNAGAAGIPLDKCLVQIEPVQEGTGDPSPDNVRPISGWTKAKVFVSPTTDEADGTTYTISFPSEAGTVYGGTLDAVTGELIVNRVGVDLGTLDWKYRASGSNITPYFWASTVDAPFPGNIKYEGNYLDTSYKMLCAKYSVAKRSGKYFVDKKITVDGTESEVLQIQIKDSSYTDGAAFKVSASGVLLVYELASPIIYNLSPQEIHTLLGVNNIWADTGDIEVKFKNIKEFF